MHHSFHKNTIFNTDQRKVSSAPNYHIRMISEGSCDTEDWSNDADITGIQLHLKSSDAKASKCHLKFSSLMMIFIKLVYLSSVISLKRQ